MLRMYILLIFILLTSNPFSMKLKEGDKFICTGLFSKYHNRTNDSHYEETFFYKDMKIQAISLKILKDNFIEYTNKYGEFKFPLEEVHHFKDKYTYYIKESRENGGLIILSKETEGKFDTNYKKNGDYILFSIFPEIHSYQNIVTTYKYKCIKVKKN